MFRDLTFQQFCSLDYGRNMVVTAGPGAGKTRILSRRFCFILLTDDSVTIPQILTLTFTEKAAEEMKSRIYEILCRIDNHLQKKGNDIIKQRIGEARQRFHKNRISTIHSFCAGLLREHPVEAGVDPGFSIIKGAGRQRLLDRALDKSVSDFWQANRDEVLPLLQSFGSRSRLLDALQNVIEHPCSFKRVIQTRNRLTNIKGWERQVFREYCKQIKDDVIIPYITGLQEINMKKGHNNELIPLLEDWYENRRDDLDNYGLPHLFSQLRTLVKTREVSSSRLTVSEGLRSISYIDLVERFFPDLFVNDTPDMNFIIQLNSFLSLANMCLNKYEEEKARINSLDFGDLEAKTLTFLNDLLNSENQHELKLIQKKFRYIMVDEFQDTNRDQWEIIKLLCAEKDDHGVHHLQSRKLFVVGDKRQAIYKFRGGDVTVFESVTKQIKKSNSKIGKKIFWEDPKTVQFLKEAEIVDSIYIKEIQDSFKDLPNGIKKDILNGDIYLPHNFRTSSRPMDFVNHIFEEIFSNKHANDIREYETIPKKIIMPDEKIKDPVNKGSVSLYLCKSYERGQTKAESAAVLIAEIIESIMGVHGNDRYEYLAYPDIRQKIENNQLAIGILFFSFTNIKIFENIFREASIPFSIHRGKGFFRCREVMDIIQLLNYIRKGQEISLLSTLRSPIFGLTDPELFDLFYGEKTTSDRLISSDNRYVGLIRRQINLWRRLSNSMTLSELIRKIISDRYLTALNSIDSNGMQRLANLEKLMEIARRFQEDGEGSLTEFVEYCLTMAEHDEEEGEAIVLTGNGNPINLMTIHSSKGLEFPMVIIPDLDRNIPNRSKNGIPVRLYSVSDSLEGRWNSCEGEIPVWPIELPSMDFRKGYTPLGHLLAKRNRLEDIAENRRVFYVGSTRTKDHLILTGHMKMDQMGDKKRPLSSVDYREHATIMAIMDDIYGFNLKYPPDEAGPCGHEGEGIRVLWKDTKPREFSGIKYAEEKIDSGSLGVYDDEVKKLDLTEAVKSHEYLQLSFRSLYLFRKCPLRFYYSVILGLKTDDIRAKGTATDSELIGSMEFERNDDHDYGSGEALFLGGLIHKYLEKHHFGDHFNEGLFTGLWGRSGQTASEAIGLKKEILGQLKVKAYDNLINTVRDRRLITLFDGDNGMAEVPFFFTMPEGFEFRGVIDRLFRDNRGLWTIIDWKSNDLREKEPYNVARENDYHLQLACYKWAVEHLTGEKVKDTYIYFTDKGVLVNSVYEEHPLEIINGIIAKVRDNGMDNGKWKDELDSKENELSDCMYCEYRGAVCEGGNGSVPDSVT